MLSTLFHSINIEQLDHSHPAPSSHRTGKEPRGLAERWLNDLSDLIPLHQQYVRAVLDVVAQHQAPLVDLYTEFNRLPQEDLARSFHKDGIHLTGKEMRRSLR